MCSCELDLGFEWGFSTVAGYTAKVTDKIRSRHAGGTVVSFCDGHQQFLSDSVSVDVFKQLMTPWARQRKDSSRYYNPLQGVLDESSY